jgi:serine/threonine-protein kinase RsbW
MGLAMSSLRTGRAPVTLRVPFAASSVSVARQQLKGWMAEDGCAAEDIDDARLVISELVANSIRHAQPLPDGNILVHWEAQPDGLEITVTDGGSGTRPRKVNAPSSALAGRGMAIVDSLALAWWADRSGTRASVHAILAA